MILNSNPEITNKLNLNSPTDDTQNLQQLEYLRMRHVSWLQDPITQALIKGIAADAAARHDLALSRRRNPEEAARNLEVEAFLLTVREFVISGQFLHESFSLT